jgi:D-serine deaminase-like pyridoxal phosphate-dependent protein
MPDVFTPLTPAAITSGGGTTIASSSAFKPLPAPTAAAGATSAAPGACAAKPAITLQRKGNTVTSIRVQCGCGQVIDINCQY